MMDASQVLLVAAACAPQISTATALALVSVESGFNPNAIGVVGAVLERQPRTRAEAVATARALSRSGLNFSLGLAQINQVNLERLGLSVETALEPCANLQAMQAILGECFVRAPGKNPLDSQARQLVLRNALSCYYSGNFTTGFDHGYVRKVAIAAAKAAHLSTTTQLKEKP